MSFKIIRNELHLTKGDTGRFTIDLLKIAGVKQEYELSDADDIYFIVTRHPDVVKLSELEKDENCIFYKKGKDIVINPEDTEELENDIYYYHVRVVLAVSGDTNTIIEPNELYLTPLTVEVM